MKAKIERFKKRVRTLCANLSSGKFKNKVYKDKWLVVINDETQKVHLTVPLKLIGRRADTWAMLGKIGRFARKTDKEEIVAMFEYSPTAQSDLYGEKLNPRHYFIGGLDEKYGGRLTNGLWLRPKLAATRLAREIIKLLDLQ